MCKRTLYICQAIANRLPAARDPHLLLVEVRQLPLHMCSELALGTDNTACSSFRCVGRQRVHGIAYNQRLYVRRHAREYFRLCESDRLVKAGSE